jgi:hypothetical protein
MVRLRVGAYTAAEKVQGLVAGALHGMAVLRSDAPGLILDADGF